MTEPAAYPTTRRGFLKLAAAGTAAALSRPLPAGAAEKTITILHESSFIKPFDDYVANTLAPAYEKETGIKINYEVTSVGSLPTRISTIAETGSGADITMNGLLQVIQFGDKYLDVGDIAEDIGKAQGGWYDAGREAVLVEGQMEGNPLRQYRPIDELAHRLVRRGRSQEVPGDLGRGSTRSARS
ncbi:extracellular solute-binding protein [Bradyrhizobium sp. ISRA435]|nr:extracellular solute-binding protein [Bradyrhizobium sp. ISRA435]